MVEKTEEQLDIIIDKIVNLLAVEQCTIYESKYILNP